MDEIFPVLTPLAVDPVHPFPYISDLSLSLAVTVRDPGTGEQRFARIKVPPVLPRLWEVAPRTYVLLEQVIAANLDALFPGMEIVEHHLFRVTRNADLSIEEDEADDLLMAIEEELRKRRFGKVVRLEVERSMPHADARAAADAASGSSRRTSTRSRACSTCAASTPIADLDMPEPPAACPGQPVTPPRLSRRPTRTRRPTSSRAIRERRRPAPPPLRVVRGSVQRFIEQAAEDPDVLTIKMTLYRTSGDSPIVARPHRGRRAAASRSSSWSRSRPASTSAPTSSGPARSSAPAPTSPTAWSASRPTRKAALVVRREGRRPAPLRPHRHRQLQPQDRAHLHRPRPADGRPGQLTADVTDLFNVLTGVARKDSYRELLVAPVTMRSGIIEPHRRRRSSGTGRTATAASSSSATPSWTRSIIAALYRASQAGVRVDLIVRGMCSLQPGVPGVSETIRVRSIVGRYLEHSRIFVFGQGERERFFIGSADIMERNLDRRVEALAPVKDPAAQARLREIIGDHARDDRRAWTLGADGQWRRAETAVGNGSEAAGSVDTFEELMRPRPTPAGSSA